VANGQSPYKKEKRIFQDWHKSSWTIELNAICSHRKECSNLEQAKLEAGKLEKEKRVIESTPKLMKS
jgi:hypothetical protein